MTAPQAKEALRTQLHAQRLQLDRSCQQQWDQRIFQHLQALPVYQRARSLMLYLSTPVEVNTWPILDDAWQRGCAVSVPKVLGRQRGMVAWRIDDRQQLQEGVMGIMEPTTGVVVEPQDLDLVIVPGLAFAEDGYRLGYGAGYYDRFLAAAAGVTVGLVYACFVRPVPRDPWDVAVDWVLTENGICKKGNDGRLTN